MIVLQALYFILPAYIANMMPVLCKWLPALSIPIHRRLFGEHKTYRGIICGIAGGIITIALQKKIATTYAAAEAFSLLSYASFTIRQILIFGAAFGGGALLGDALKSFLKRRLGIAPGRPFIPFDQLDFIIGALAAVSFLFFPPWPHIAIIVIATPPLHLLTNILAYALRLKKVWW